MTSQTLLCALQGAMNQISFNCFSCLVKGRAVDLEEGENCIKIEKKEGVFCKKRYSSRELSVCTVWHSSAAQKPEEWSEAEWICGRDTAAARPVYGAPGLTVFCLAVHPRSFLWVQDWARKELDKLFLKQLSSEILFSRVLSCFSKKN